MFRSDFRERGNQTETGIRRALRASSREEVRLVLDFSRAAASHPSYFVSICISSSTHLAAASRPGWKTGRPSVMNFRAQGGENRAWHVQFHSCLRSLHHVHSKSL